MNEENIVENEANVNEDLSSSKASDVEEKTQEVQTSEPNMQEPSQDYTQLVEQVQYINQHLDTITNILIVVMVGVGIVVGIIACDIFSRYFKS